MVLIHTLARGKNALVQERIIVSGTVFFSDDACEITTLPLLPTMPLILRLPVS
jgi:hypothetical protein